MNPINIISDTPGLGGALTNPTEISFRKGKVLRHYPITFMGITYPDAEAAYKAHIAVRGPIPENQALMTAILGTKLEQHPILMRAITQAGGAEWLATCRHVGYKGAWEGIGPKSAFIACLISAYTRRL
jgi:hypothetical protein